MSTPEALISRVIERRCGALLGELHAIASVELGDHLEAIHAGRALTTQQQGELARYLSSELDHCGMLSLAQLRSGTDDATAKRINRQGRILLSLVQS